MKEQRRLERFQLELPAKIEVLRQAQEKEVLDLLTKNICAGGAFFHTTNPLPNGTRVKIDLILPLDKLKKLKDFDKAYIKVNGTVIRSESAGMAICFNEDYEITPL